MTAHPSTCDAFLAGFLEAVSRIACDLPGEVDQERRKEAAAGMLLRRLFLRFAREAPFGTGWASALLPQGAGAPGSPAEQAASSLFESIASRFDFRLAEPWPPHEPPADEVLAPDILAAAHAVARAGRHADGVFYTPSGEVCLMCREALRIRLAPALGLSDDDASLLGVLYGEGESDLPPAMAIALFRALARLRICDPAAGCGALLVGMAHEMARALASLGRLVAPESREALRRAGLPDPFSVFAIRRHVAASALFGVDLDAGALWVARQRLALFTLATVEAREPDAATLAALQAHVREGDGLAPPGEGQHAAVQLSLFGESGVQPPPAPPVLGGQGEAVPAPGLNTPHELGGPGGASPWHERFSKVFGAPGGGFDVVLSNPPYVRQELLDGERKSAAPRACRALLPTDILFDGKSDLYAYFYHLGLGLLREGGALCVISSNSWLDVGFGAALRALLLRHSRILSVTESARESTFADARINPAILLARRGTPAADETEPVRFIRMRCGLGEARALDEMALLAGADRFLSLPAFRVVPVPQGALAAEAAGGTGGTGWGGRYLRAPDLFFEVLEACGARLCRLDALASVRFGIKTGANDFFYLERVEGRTGTHDSAAGGTLLVRNGMGESQLLEARCLRPVLRSPRELRTPELLPETLSAFLLACTDPPETLAGTAVGEYVEKGECRWGVHLRPSVRSRPRWYAVPRVPPPPVIHPLIAFERACAAVNPSGILCDANLVGIYPRDGVSPDLLAACLVSSLGVMMRELAGIANLGQGALKTNPAYLARMLVPDLRAGGPEALSAVRDAFGEARRLPFPSLLDGEPAPPWRDLDDAVLALLGPGAPDGAQLRAVTREMVAARLAKARS